LKIIGYYFNMAADGNDVFVYMGGDQVVPDDVIHAVIDPSLKIVPGRAFWGRRRLVSVIFHDDVEIIEQEAFFRCVSLRGVNMLGVREIGDRAFGACHALSGVEFGSNLESVGGEAFYNCTSLRSIKMPSVRTIQQWAFGHCYQLIDAEFGVDLERIGPYSFYKSTRLRRIAIPLKDNLFPFDIVEQQYNQFEDCENLTAVDIVGAEEINNTISSLLLESWRDGMNQEIDRINQELPDTHVNETTNAIRLRIRSVLGKMEHYKAEHNRLLKEHMTQLELAVWKAKLDEKESSSTLKVQTKRAKLDVESMRKEKRITSGADIIIKNVLPFLKLG